MDTWIDGCGVLADQPLPDGARIRFRLDPSNPLHDVTAHVAGGRLHLGGMNLPLVVEPVDVHRAAVGTRAIG